ncbi:MAG: SDR family oxidoreductase [Cyclobacteriaceae bacterium]|nr:SDR family oxidoreductase [Cyclobacteriaceae bacterium]
MKSSIVVTGGTKGIGRAIINLFADKGFDIITCSRSEADLEVLAAEINAKYPKIAINSMVADLSKKEEAFIFSDFVKSTVRELKVLVNNSGAFVPGAITEEKDGDFENMINTNLSSAYHITRNLISSVKMAKGHIFNMCSTASIMPYVNGGSYCISKYALLGMTKVLREEMKPFDVRVTAIMPGATYTTSWEGSDLPEDRFMKADDVAHAIWGAYAMSPRSVVEEILIRPQLGDI